MGADLSPTEAAFLVTRDLSGISLFSENPAPATWPQPTFPALALCSWQDFPEQSILGSAGEGRILVLMQSRIPIADTQAHCLC